jgi:phage shock protein PspC (stress-responsive transcriptional regulator)
MNSADLPTPEPGTGGTVPPAGPNPPHTPDRVDYFFDSIRRIGLVRANDRWVGGVASGIGLRLGVDALLVRAAFGVLALLSGAGFIFYAIGWTLLPEQSDGRIHLQEAIRGRFDSALAGAGILLVLGMPWRSGFGWWGSWGYGWFDGLFGVALVAFVIYLFVTLRKQRNGQPGAPRPPYTPQPPYTPPAPYMPQPPYGPPGFDPRRGQAPGQYGPAPFGPAQTQTPTPPQTFAGTPSVAPPNTGTPTDTTAPFGPTAQGTFASSVPGAGSSASSPSSAGGAPQFTPPPAARVPQPPYTTQPIRPAGAAPGYVPPRYPHQPSAGAAYPLRPFQPAPASTKVMEPPRKGPGAAAFGIVVGLSLLTFAILLATDRAGHFDESVGLTTIGVSVILAGLCIAIAGLRGKTSGAVGFIALVAIIVGAPLATAASYGVHWNDGAVSFAGDHVFVPGNADDASDGYAVGFGNLTVDLTAMDIDRGESVTVPVQVGAGKITIILPRDVPASAEVSLGAGKATWDVDGDSFDQKGFGTNSGEFETDAVRNGAEPTIHLEVEAGAGKVVIEEEP